MLSPTIPAKMEPVPELVGRSLGAYRIISQLGAGGMGQVYRALDVRLGREVAVKVLPPEFCRDQTSLQRFELEARVLAALNDPHLLVIYDVGVHEGQPYLVSELLEGQTLHAKMRAGRLAYPQIVDFAQQILRGLITAHDKHIIHRDLKPENIYVTKGDRLKILDFGLAKLRAPEGEWNHSDAATMATASGTIVGTIAYMSPEQLRGYEVDARTDLFAFGAILYEMLTGRRAFQGETAADTVSAVLNSAPPDMSQVELLFEEPAARILRHCLEKKPEDRYQSARDLAFDIAALASPASSAAAKSKRLRPTGRFPRLTAALACVLLVAALGLGWLLGYRRPPSPPSYQQITFQRGTVWSARLTADGHTIVYSAAWGGSPLDVFFTRVDSGESRSLGMTGATVLAVSPQGELAVLLNAHDFARFVRRGMLARVPLGGGAPREILEDVQQADWAPDGSNLAVVHEANHSNQLEYPIGHILFKTSGWISDPRISPDGRRIAFLEDEDRGDDRGWVAVVDLSGRRARISEEWSSAQGLAWSPDGKEVWTTATRLGEGFAVYASTLDGKERTVSRAPTDLKLDDVLHDGSVLLSSYKHSTPVVALAPGQNSERDITPLDDVVIFDLSDDGTMFLFQYYGQGSGTNYTSYLGKTDGAPAKRLGEGAAVALSPDGRWALTIMNQPREALLVPTGAGLNRKLDRTGIDFQGAENFAPDGTHVLFIGSAPGQRARSYIQAIDGGRPQPLTPEGITGTLLSPDGKFLLAADAKGALLLYPLHGGEAREVRGLGSGDEAIRWGRNGHLFCFDRSTGANAIYDLDPWTGRKTVLSRIVPADPGGIVGRLWIRLSADGKAYVYSFQRYLSELYLVKGL